MRTLTKEGLSHESVDRLAKTDWRPCMLTQDWRTDTTFTHRCLRNVLAWVKKLAVWEAGQRRSALSTEYIPTLTPSSIPGIELETANRCASSVLFNPSVPLDVQFE